MTKYKSCHINFNVSKREDLILYDALLRYPAGVRSHIMRTALAAYLLKATEGTAIPVPADFYDREAPPQGGLSTDQKRHGIDQPAKIAPDSGRQSPEAMPSHNVPELNESERRVLQGMLAMIQ